MKINLEKYDKMVWRINGTLVLLACLGAILMCTFVGIKLLMDALRPRQVHDMVNVDQRTEKEEFLRLGRFEILKGTNLFLTPLTSEQKYETSYYSKSAYSRARNYLIFDTTTKESYWIWKNNDHLVLEEYKIFDQISGERLQKTKGLIFEFVEKNSNGDSVLNDLDQKTLQYFDLSTKNNVTIIKDFDRLVGVQQAADNEVLVFYSRSGKSFFKSLLISTMTASDEKSIGVPL